jgi:hypothetical protein
MTDIAASRRRNAGPLRRSSTGHAGARSNTQSRTQFDQSWSFNLNRPHRTELLIRRNIANQSFQSRHRRSPAQSAALQSP